MTARHIVVDATPYGPRPTGARRRAEALLRRLPRLLPKDVFEVHWAADGGGPPADLADEARAPSNLVHDLACGSHRGGWRRVLRRQRALRARYRVAPFTHLLTDYGPVVPRGGVRALVTVHDLRFFDGHERGMRALLRRRAAHNTWPWATLLACSEFTQAALARQGFDAEVIYGAADVRPEVPRQPGEALLVIGRDEPRKAWGAAQAVAATLGRELIVVEGDHEEDALGDALARAAWLLAPSLYEGFDLPVVEALAAGCPVLASRIPAHEELVARGAQGIQLVAPPTRDGAAWSWPEALVHLGRGSAPGAIAPPPWTWDEAAARVAALITEES